MDSILQSIRLAGLAGGRGRGGEAPTQQKARKTRGPSAPTLAVAGSTRRGIISSGQVLVVLGATKTNRACHTCAQHMTLLYNKL